MLPDLSIVIPSHRRADLLRSCLASVTRHAPAETEIIVVDDGSSDGAVTRAAREFPSVWVLRLPRRRGFCAAANAGIRQARGRIVELLNDDTEVLPGWVDAALPCFRDATVGAVAPLVLVRSEAPTNGLRIDSAGDRYYLGGVARKRGHGEPVSDAYLHSCPVFGASGSSAFYRRDALLAVGAFPEPFGAYFEDVDLSFRLHRAGLHVRYEPGSRVLHRVSSSHAVDDRRLLQQQSLNEERVFWRNVPASWLRRAVPRHLAVLAAKSLTRCGEGSLAPFLCGRLRILAEIPEILKHRRQLDAMADGIDAWQVEERWTR